MILTALAMYLNVVYGSDFNYFITFIADMLLLSIFENKLKIKIVNLDKKEKE